MIEKYDGEMTVAQSLRQRQDSVPRTKAIYERAMARFNRLEKLHKQGAISQEQLEQAEAELEQSQTELSQLQLRSCT